MPLARRALLLAAPLFLAAAAPGGAPALRLEPSGDDQVALTGPGVRRVLLLPAAGARLLAPTACGGEVLAVAAFQQEDGAAAVEWGALALALDGAVALLALEPLA